MSDLTGNYIAGAFHPELPRGRGGGHLVVADRAVRFVGESGQFELPMRGLRCELGGAADRLIFFKHPQFPGWAIHTADHRVLDEPALQADPELHAQLQKMRGRKHRARAVIACLLALCALTAAGLWMLKDHAVRLVASQVPASVETTMGEAAWGQLKLQYTVIEDEQLQRSLEQMASRLLAVVPQERYRYQLHIVEDSSMNAFALPGGHVAVFSGLLLAADSAEEVTGVLAHELAHVTQQHGTRQIISSLGMIVVLQAVVGDLGSVAAVLGNAGAKLLSLDYSRSFEREADDVGLKYLLEAEIDPRGMVGFFEKLRAKETAGDAPAAVLQMLSTHPATQERIERLTQQIEAVDAGAELRQIDVDFRAFQDELRARLERQPAQPGDVDDASQN